MIEYLHTCLQDFLRYSDAAPWLFTRRAFWVFFGGVVGLYSLFYRRTRMRNIYLMLISLFFYYKTGGWFVSLLLFSAFSNYLWGRWIGSAHTKGTRTTFLLAGLMTNFGMLIYYKYAYFFTDLLNQLIPDTYETYNWLAYCWNACLQTHFSVNDILLPVGISFFTFQAVSYLVDVYTRRTDVVRNLFDFTFYLSFFPQLVAGPIVRASAFIPQIYRKYEISKREFGHALFLIMTGLVKKLVFADFLAINYTDRIFEQPSLYSGVENLMAIYAYALQIYCDFSGYTDMAIGIALLLGFRLPINFNSPYKATSLSDFWRRWHISLSTWLRDYLYIPLGGNRKGKIRTAFNLMVTMLLGGLWHGAHFKFIIWGGLHGTGLLLEKMMHPFQKKYSNRLLVRMIFIFIVFHFVCLGWMFFRAETMADVMGMFHQLIYAFRLEHLWRFIIDYKLIASLLTAGFFFHWIPAGWQESIRGKFIEWPLWGKGLVVLVILLVVNYFLLADIQAFIYFRF
ncbi:MAG: MBOAT family protein [Prolixibacteraceae bacterium]|nr:MBOAT family protein [Prolixibacteraceae bacterium]